MMFNKMRFNILRILILLVMPLFVLEVNAQEIEVAVKADTTKVDSVVNVKPAPIRPVRTLGKVAVIDTLATESDAISIVLFNDNNQVTIVTRSLRESHLTIKRCIDRITSGKRYIYTLMRTTTTWTIT